MFPRAGEAVVAENVMEMQRLPLIFESAVKHEPPDLERAAPDQRQGQRVGEHRSDRRGDDVAADDVADDRRHDDVEAEERRRGSENAGRHTGRDRMRSSGQPQHALRQGQRRLLHASWWRSLWRQIQIKVPLL